MPKIISFFFLLIIAKFSLAQQYNFVNYSIEEGLVQSQIRSICQDNDGYLWIGTLGGVSKFDGIHFTNFSVKDGLLNNQVNFIYKSNSGEIYFGTQGGITVYDGINLKSLSFKNELKNNFVTSITQDNKGIIWIGTDGGGLVNFDAKTKQFNYIEIKDDSKSNYIRDVKCDKQKNIWLATRNGIWFLDAKNQLKDTIKNLNVSHLFIDSDAIWCSTFGTGVLCFSKDTTINYTEKEGLLSNHIRDFVKRRDGSFWFASKSGISKLADNTFTNFTAKDGLMNENIKCIIEDAEGNLFLGSDGSGLIKFTNENFTSYTQNDGLNSDVIMSIIRDNKNNLWLASYDKGVCEMNDKNCYNYSEKNGLANNTVWCQLIDNRGNMWFGTSSGVTLYNGKTFKNYSIKEGLNAKKIYALNQDESGKIWIGTKEGVSVLFPSNDSIYNYPDVNGINRNVRYIYNDNEQNLWLCSSDGLFKYNTQTNTAEQFTTKNGLPDNSIMTVVKDKFGVIWVGTKNGLAYYHNKKFITITIPDNYAANNINFLKTGNGSLWIGTNYGLYQLLLNNNQKYSKTSFIHYTNLDGLKSLECNQNAAFIDGNFLWFGTSKGLMKFNFKKEKNAKQLPRVHLTSIRLFYENQDWTKYTRNFVKNSNLPNSLTLNYNKNHLTFDFIGIFLTGPDKVKYRFKLLGFDENWQPITKANFVTYSNIPPGKYNFQLSASTDLINWTKPITFNFQIKPPFWLTWWFYSLATLLVLFILWGLDSRRKRVAQRKLETQLIIDQSKMLKLEQQALNASMNRHFIFNSLNSIQYYINRQDKISANKYLTNFAKLVRKNLDSSLENDIYIDEEIERIELYLKLEQMRFKDKFDYKIYIDKSIENQSIKIPSMLLQPFIENAIWHGILPSEKTGLINVNINKKDNQILIDIIDNGIGINESLKLKSGKTQHHTSKGMELIKGRVNLVSKITNNKCYIIGPDEIYDKNKSVKGTKVTIIISLPKMDAY